MQHDLTDMHKILDLKNTRDTTNLPEDKAICFIAISKLSPST